MSYKTYLDEWFGVDEPYDSQSLNAVQDNQLEIWDVLTPVPTYYFPGKNTVNQETFRTVQPPRNAVEADIFRKFASPGWECIWIRPYIIQPGTEKLVLHLFAAATGNWNTGSSPPASEDDGAFIQFTESFDRPRLEPDSSDSILKISTATPDYFSIDLRVTISDVPQITYLQLWYKSTTPRVQFFTPGEYWEDSGGTAWQDKAGPYFPIDIVYPDDYIAMSDYQAVGDYGVEYNSASIQANIPQPGLDDTRLLELCTVRRNAIITSIEITDFGGVAGLVFEINIASVANPASSETYTYTSLAADTPEIVADALAVNITTGNPTFVVESSGRKTVDGSIDSGGSLGASGVIVKSYNGDAIGSGETPSYYEYTISVSGTGSGNMVLEYRQRSKYSVVNSHKILGYRGGKVVKDGRSAIGYWILPAIKPNFVSFYEPVSTARSSTGFAISELGYFQPFSIGVEEVRREEYIRDFTAKDSVMKPGGSTQTRTPFELLLGDGVNISRSRVLSFGGSDQSAGARQNYYADFAAQRPGDTPIGSSLTTPEIWATENYKFLREPRLCPLAIGRRSASYAPGGGLFPDNDVVGTANDPIEVYIPITGTVNHNSIRVLFLMIGENGANSRSVVSVGATTIKREVLYPETIDVLVEVELMEFSSSSNSTPTVIGSATSGPVSFSPAISASQVYDVQFPEYDEKLHLGFWNNFVEGVYNVEDVKLVMAAGRFGSIKLTGIPEQTARPTYSGSVQQEPYVLKFKASINTPGIDARVKLVGYTVISESA
jgi:hypothetical protein